MNDDEISVDGYDDMDMAALNEKDFEGHQPNECGEHRTLGPHRAWCFVCSEYCYPAAPCRGCELPQLRSLINDLAHTLNLVMTSPHDDKYEEVERVMARYRSYKARNP